jgi:hypothetical protein
VSSGRALTVAIALVVMAAAWVAWLVLTGSPDDGEGMSGRGVLVAVAPEDAPATKRRHVESGPPAAGTAVVKSEEAVPVALADPDDVVVRVVSPDGEQVEAAQVLISGWGREIGASRDKPRPLAAGRTDAGGAARLHPRRPARMVIVAREGELAGWANTIALEHAGTRELEVRLGPALVVDGRVLDQFGRPLAGLSIAGVFQPEKPSLHRLREDVTTGVDGSFRFPAIPDSVLGSRSTLLFAGSRTFLACSSEFDGRPDERGWTLIVARAAPLSARVMFVDGSAAAGAGVSVQLVEGGRGVDLTADEVGLVAGRVPTGRVVLSARMRTPDGVRSHERELVIDDKGVKLGTVLLDGETTSAARERLRNARQGR